MKTVRFSYQSSDGGWSPCSISMPSSIMTDGSIQAYCKKDLTEMKIPHKKIAIISVEEEESNNDRTWR